MYYADAVEIGAGEPTEICAVGIVGPYLQVLAGGPVTLCGPRGEFGKGLLLAKGDSPLQVPGGYSSPLGIGQAAEALTIYGVCDEGSTARVAYLKHDLPAS